MPRSSFPHHPPTKLPPSRRTAHRWNATLAVPEHMRGLTDYIPNARLFVVPGGGHWLFGHTEEVMSEITQLLRNNVAMVKNSRTWSPATAQG